MLDGLARLDMRDVREIRLRKGQPVIICTGDGYKYLGREGAYSQGDCAFVCEDPQRVLYDAMEGSVFAFTEQLKSAFITVDGGVRIGIGGEYVANNGKISAIKNVTSLNIRIPHDVKGCAEGVVKALGGRLCDILLFSRPGYGKTTMLRDIARQYSRLQRNVLICDERSEIALADGEGRAADMGQFTDIVRGGDKLTVFANALRAMRPDIIVTDELYGQDFMATDMAKECGVNVVASTHVCDRKLLRGYAFDYYIHLAEVGRSAAIYDKDFNFIGDCSTVGDVGSTAVGRKEEEGKGVRGAV